MKRIITVLAGAAAAALVGLAPAASATAAPAHVVVRTGCSTAYLDGDYRLGPALTPNRGAVAVELTGYRRLAGMTPGHFLARYWDQATGSWKYPPDDGFLIVHGTPIEFRLMLEPGEPLDRYGSLYGSFLAPAGTPYAARSIPPSSLDDVPGFTCNYHSYVVRRPFNVEAGPVAPAFGQPGAGLQYQLRSALLPGDPAKASVQWLLDHGYLIATS